MPLESGKNFFCPLVDKILQKTLFVTKTTVYKKS
jgi:hypothetical protein